MATKTEKNRRTPDQIVADLEAKIASVKARQAARAAKARPEIRALLLTGKTIDKAMAVAREAGNEKIARELWSAYAVVVDLLRAEGIELAVHQAKGATRRKKGEAAA
jgi:hypothetical protein